MGQTSGWFYSPECSISPFTCCHLNHCRKSAACTEYMKEVISGAVQQCKIWNTPLNNEEKKLWLSLFGWGQERTGEKKWVLRLLELKELSMEGIAWISNIQGASLVVGLKCPGIRWLSYCVITSRLKIVGYAALTQKTDDFSDIHL